jgi:hypothetical protein
MLPHARVCTGRFRSKLRRFGVSSHLCTGASQLCADFRANLRREVETRAPVQRGDASACRSPRYHIQYKSYKQFTSNHKDHKQVLLNQPNIESVLANKFIGKSATIRIDRDVMAQTMTLEALNCPHRHANGFPRFFHGFYECKIHESHHTNFIPKNQKIETNKFKCSFKSTPF